jgi:hypothetical protein
MVSKSGKSPQGSKLFCYRSGVREDEFGFLRRLALDLGERGTIGYAAGTRDLYRYRAGVIERAPALEDL